MEIGTEFFESIARCDIAKLETIVETVAPHLMSEGVELGGRKRRQSDDARRPGRRCRTQRPGYAPVILYHHAG